MLATPSLVSPSRTAGPADRRGRRVLDQDVVCARIALEERYLRLMSTRDRASVDELQGVRARLHQLAEIEADPQAPGRDAALQTWLRAAR